MNRRQKLKEIILGGVMTLEEWDNLNGKEKENAMDSLERYLLTIAGRNF